MHESSEPTISIVLPSYNRARFLAEAFGSIRAQTYADWELIVVDDGSTDDTGTLISELSRDLSQPVRYQFQPNQGPAAARNAGIGLARGTYIAFYDSDDLWRPHHLANCVEALRSNPEVDWVYGACQLVDLTTREELQSSSFHPNGGEHPFLRLSTRAAGGLRVITDPDVTKCMIAHGLMCGFQCSVLRHRVFNALRLPPHRIGEDRIFAVQALKAGFTLAYFDDVHAVYRVHENASSAREGSGAFDRSVAGLRELVSAFETLPHRVSLTKGEQRALQRRLADECFWTLGYGYLWRNGRRTDALKAFRQGLCYCPWDLRLWKTYGVALVRTAMSFGS